MSVLKEKILRLKAVIWANKKGGQEYSCPPQHIHRDELWSESPKLSTFYIIPGADQDAPLIQQSCGIP